MPESITLKDPGRESRIFLVRTLTAVLIACALLAGILYRYYDLQIRDYETYRTQSERNRVQLQPLPPKRGLIYDRNGVLLAAITTELLADAITHQPIDSDNTKLMKAFGWDRFQ